MSHDMFAYIATYGNQTLVDLPVTPVDQLIWNELCYLPFSGLVTESFCLDKAISLRALHQQAYVRRQVWQVWPGLVTDKRLALFEAVAGARRYQDLQFMGYREDLSVDRERQFAAMVVTSPRVGYSQVVFRGTDTSLIGWKEDFMMTYRSEVPAQALAASYLQEFLDSCANPVVISGHSKGGNLALYASLKVPDGQQDRIQAILTYDAPGLHPRLLADLSDSPLLARLSAYRPQESLVGVMLEMPEQTQTICSQGQLLMQHSVFNWQVLDQAFKPAQSQTLLSQTMEKVFALFLDALPNQDLKTCVDVVFDSLILAGVGDLADFQTDFIQTSRRTLDALSSIPADKRQLLANALTTLMSLIFRQSLKSVRHRARQQLPSRPGLPTTLTDFWRDKK